MDSGLCSRYGVSGYPTLKSFVHGVVKDYTAGRQLDDIVKVGKMLSEPSVKAVESRSAVEDLAKEDITAVIFLLEAAEGAEIHRAYEAVALNYFDKARFLRVAPSDDAAPGQIKLLCFKDESFVDFDIVKGANGITDVTSFVDAHWQSSTPQLDSGNFRALTSRGTAAVAILRGSDAATKQKAIRAMREISKSSVGSHFQWSWLDGEAWTEFVTQSLGVDMKTLPRLVLWEPDAYMHWTWENVTADSLDSMQPFLDAFATGNVTPQGEGATNIFYRLRKYFFMLYAMMSENIITVVVVSVAFPILLLISCLWMCASGPTVTEEKKKQ